MMNESNIDELAASLIGSRIAQLLACQRAELSIQSKAAPNQTMDLTNLKEEVKTTKNEEINAFLSKIIYGQTKMMLLRNNMHVMTQSMKGCGVMDPTLLMA